MAALALVLLGCDADEGRDPARPSLALTAAMETTSGGGEETTTSGASASTSTSTSSTSSASTSTTSTSSTSSGGLGESTSSEGTSTTDDGSSSGGDTTGEDLTTSTTTGEEPPCPCTPEIAQGQNLCAQEPTPDCPATLPGGICDPDGDGSFADGDWIAGYHGYLAACA